MFSIDTEEERQKINQYTNDNNSYRRDENALLIPGFNVKSNDYEYSSSSCSNFEEENKLFS